jgi:hypothetical protein
VQPSHVLIDRPVEKGGTDMGRVPSITLQWKVTALARIGLSACGQSVASSAMDYPTEADQRQYRIGRERIISYRKRPPDPVPTAG